MKSSGKGAGGKFTRPVWVVIALGVIVFALPISENIKFLLLVPLYVLFLVAYYKYNHKKRSS